MNNCLIVNISDYPLELNLEIGYYSIINPGDSLNLELNNFNSYNLSIRSLIENGNIIIDFITEPDSLKFNWLQEGF